MPWNIPFSHNKNCRPMTREIKFRSWNIEEKRRATHNELLSDISVTASVLAPSVLIVHDSRYKIMQFTWLYDKNNQPIYEWDIVRHLVSEYRWYINSVVERKEFEWWPTIHEPSTIWFRIFDEAEIIWNLYEHPHLLTSSQWQTNE